MRIGIDCRMIHASGIGRYLRNLILNLEKLDTKDEYFLFVLKEDFSKFKLGSNFHFVEADFGWYSVEEQFKFPFLLRKFRLDLMHFPHFNVPLFYDGKFVVTIHDLIHQHFQINEATTHNPLVFFAKKKGYNLAFSKAVKSSSSIICPSEFIKNQLILEWNVSPEKIHVTYEGVDDTFTSFSKHSQDIRFSEIRKKIKIDNDYLFYVGNAHPHKNLSSLIEAFEEFNRKFSDYKLILAGKTNFFWEKIKEEIKQKQIKNVNVIGYIDDLSLASLLSHAKAFIFPSLEEGFGIPILESFAMNCPVVCSKKGALEEIGKDGCLYFNPNDISDMQLKLELICKDDDLRKKFISNGSKRLKSFSFYKMAKQTLKIYQQ